MAATTDFYIDYCEQLADALTESEWQTASYLEFEAALRARPEAPEVTTLRHLLDGALANYLNSPVLPEEVTTEARAGHQILQRGLQGWLAAITMVQNSPNLAKDALVLAEDANRLLVSVALFQEELALAAARHNVAAHLRQNWGS